VEAVPAIAFSIDGRGAVRDRIVVHVAARTAIDYVAYVIAARSLWVSGQR
jgi:hypothetical protein